jgi:hypothetical protein
MTVMGTVASSYHRTRGIVRLNVLEKCQANELGPFTTNRLYVKIRCIFQNKSYVTLK